MGKKRNYGGSGAEEEAEVEAPALAQVDAGAGGEGWGGGGRRRLGVTRVWRRCVFVFFAGRNCMSYVCFILLTPVLTFTARA